jgi:hypothetical protein
MGRGRMVRWFATMWAVAVGVTLAIFAAAQSGWQRTGTRAVQTHERAILPTAPSDVLGAGVRWRRVRFNASNAEARLHPGPEEHLVDTDVADDATAGDVDFCGVMAATTMSAYQAYLDVIASTYGASPLMRTYVLLNADIDTDRAKVDTLCANIKAVGSGVRCLWIHTGCTRRGKMCVTATIMTGLTGVGEVGALAACKWVIKLDTDVLFMPRSAKRFVRGLGTALDSRRHWISTLSGTLVYTGLPHLYARVQMPQGNWMVNRPAAMAMLVHLRTGNCRLPHMAYIGSDEAAVAVCAWVSSAVECATTAQDAFFIGPAGPERAAFGVHVKRYSTAKPECVVLVHKYVIADGAALYARWESQDHAAREGCSTHGEGLDRATQPNYHGLRGPLLIGWKWKNQSSIALSTDCDGDGPAPIESQLRDVPAWLQHQSAVYDDFNPSDRAGATIK